MEKLVTIVSVGVYAERQYQKQDGSQEYDSIRNRTAVRSTTAVVES